MIFPGLGICVKLNFKASFVVTVVGKYPSLVGQNGLSHFLILKCLSIFLAKLRSTSVISVAQILLKRPRLAKFYYFIYLCHMT